MRLDEWQKYLDAQFLDEEAEAKNTAARAATAKTDAGGGAAPPRHPRLPLDESAWITEATPAPPPILAKEAAALAPLESRSSASALPRITPEEPNKAPRRRGLAASEERSLLQAPLSSGADESPNASHPSSDSARNLRGPASPRHQPFGEPPTLQADIPAFERYLPATHSAVQAETDAQARRPGLAEESPAASESGSASDMLIGAFSVLMPVNTYVTPRPPLPQSKPPTLLPPDDAPLESPRRAPRSRARHARNVRPEYVPSGLSAADLWATVPKHVQTLLALGRMEEIEEEVAQSSYKRPFQQTRQELIERLLDPILSLEDTARLLNVCPTTVRRYTNKGILTYYRKEPDRPSTGSQSDKETRQRRFRLSDILAFLETQQAAIEADRQAERRGAGPPAYAGD